MARLQYVTVRESDFGAGIDQQSSENRITEGYVETAENADPKSTGQIAKRVGYQGYAGNLPVRVKSVEYDGSEINFLLDDNIKIPINQSSPIIVSGKTSEASGDFSSETIIYYPEYSSDVRKLFIAAPSSDTIPATEHLLTSPYMFVGFSESTSEVNLNNSQFLPDLVEIDTGTYEITYEYNNYTGSPFKGFVFYKDKSAVAGETYISTGHSVPNGATTIISIPSSTHNLLTNNIIVKGYRQSGSLLVEFVPDKVTLDDVTGDVEIHCTNYGGSFNATFILSVAPTVNYATGSVASGHTSSITIDTSVTGGSDFAFIACYLEPTIGGVLEQVIPDSIVSDSVNKLITVTFTNNMASGANFEIYWDFAEVKTNKLTVPAVINATFTDNIPQLNIYGLDHSEIYNNENVREGWTNHIDSYKSTAENRLVSGLGGNLYAARLQSEGTNSTDYLMPTFYPRLNSRVDSDTEIGPAFYDTGDSPTRTRGYITGDTGSTNYFEITDIEYNSGTGYVDYYLSVPNMVISGTLSTIISSTTGLEDKLSTQMCGYAFHNGQFTIKNVANPSTDVLVISVQNDNIDSSDYDETDVGGLGGVFTDRLTLTSTSPFILNDIINSELFTDSVEFTCLASNNTTLLINNVTDSLSVPGGLRLTAQRTSSIIPVRDINNISSVDNIVRGDMLTYSEIPNQLRVLSVNPLADINITITGDGTEALVTLGSGDTLNFAVGKKLLITNSASYNGTVIISEIVSSTEFKFLSSETTSESGILVGRTVEVDEQLTFTDMVDSSNLFTVHSRWIPIELPEDNYDLTEKTRVSYFDSLDYVNQEILRSTMVQDNLYLTNYYDENLKFDGINIYRSGLFRWQPNLFATTDTTATGTITVKNYKATYDTSVENRFEFTTTPEDGLAFVVGQEIRDAQNSDNNTNRYLITDIKNVSDSTGVLKKSIIYVDREILTGAGSLELRPINTYKYYFRLNAVDANDNIIASAVTGSEDFSIKLEKSAAVNIKLVSMPVFDIYDYDRLEVQIYRTKANEPAPFYRLTTLAMSFDNNEGYLSYTDTAADEDLFDLDEVNTALKGAELGTAWSQPLMAKYTTSAGNRLVLGNLRDYPTLDLRLLKKSTNLTQSIFTNSNNRRWLFRKDNTDTATTTNMVDRVAYEFTSSNVTVTGITGTLGTSFTVTAPGHGFTVNSTGQWVYLYHSAVEDANDLRYCGWWQITNVTGSNTFVISSAESGSGAAAAGTFPNRLAYAPTNRYDIPVFIGTDGNYSQYRKNRSSTEDYLFLAIFRLANAINSSMRKVNITLSGYSEFKPWLTANAGNEFNVGQLVIVQPRIFDTDLELVIPALSNDFQVFVNNIKRDGNAQAGAVSRIFPSRLIISYPNYPEIFDNPTATVDMESDSAIDINSADGQEITAIIPFFGDAAFGSAQKSGIIVVFKTNSVYLVDLSAKAAGQNAVQRLETRGKGCTAPYSVSVTRNGIMFANDTGIYRLGRDLEVEYVGQKYERLFSQTINKQQLTLATGHHDTKANSYKLSYPITGEVENSKVAVYNHTREYAGKGYGSWTTYTNHPATGWANLNADSFFASTAGRVFGIRNTGEVSDYRDDNQPIAMQVITRGFDAMDSALKKSFAKVITHYRAIANSVGTTLKTALDLKSVFRDTDTFKINKNLSTSGLDDTGEYKIISIETSVPEKNGIYLQLKYENSTIDEPVEIAAIDYRVAAHSPSGIKQAKDTQ